MSAERKELGTLNPHALSHEKSDYLLRLGLDSKDIERLQIYSYRGSIGMDNNNRYIYIDTKIDKENNPREWKEAYNKVLNMNQHYEGDRLIGGNIPGTRFLFRKPSGGDT